ncbi:hypothetical protein ASE49_10690 [Novosphingobium sp. Leaf2]|nr:hypothetical protein ASE49_10690 [Novosphingobium sp. Leaf2]
MNKNAAADAVLTELYGCIARLDDLGASLAAIHVDAAIESLCRQFTLARRTSDTDQAARD